jgi:hypothetical protein
MVIGAVWSARIPAVRRGIRCTAEWLAVSAELADLGAPTARLRTSGHANEQMAARHSSWRGKSAMSRCLSCPVFTRSLRRSSGTAGEPTASQHPW